MLKVKVNDPLITDGEVMAVYVKAGDKVEQGDSIAEIQQEKDSEVIVATHSGVIQSLTVKPGDDAKFGDVVATIDEMPVGKVASSSPKKESSHTVVIGSGPGGYVAAIRAAELGQKVTVIEDTFIGGVCLNVGCIPSKSLIHAADTYAQAKQGSAIMGIPKGHLGKIDFEQTQNWKQHDVVERLTKGVQFLMQRHGIDIIWGHAVLTDDYHVQVTLNETHEQQVMAFDQVIIATGSHPAALPNVSFSRRIIDSTGCLNLTEIPRRLVIIGGGFISAELSDVYANLGSEVTILEHSGRILKHFDSDLSAIVTKHFLSDGGKIIYDAEIDHVKENEDEVTVFYESDGYKHQITADYVLMAVGRHPNTEGIGLEKVGVKMDKHHLIEVNEQGRTNIPSIWAIGDVVAGKMLAHKASYEGKVAAEAIAGEDSRVDYKAMPAVAFTNPEIATTGRTLTDTINNDRYQAYKFNLSYNGRALSLNQSDGFIRLIVDGTSQKIVGGQIAGPSASELIGEVTLMIQNGLTVKEVADTIHPHPTISDSLVDCADDAMHLPINN